MRDRRNRKGTLETTGTQVSSQERAKGHPQIEIAYGINTDGIVHVTAKDRVAQQLALPPQLIFALEDLDLNDGLTSNPRQQSRMIGASS